MSDTSITVTLLHSWKIVTDKNNNVCFEVLTIHYDSYHSSLYQPHFDTSDNVCLDLQNWSYSIFIENPCLLLRSIYLFYLPRYLVVHTCRGRKVMKTFCCSFHHCFKHTTEIKLQFRSIFNFYHIFSSK